MSKSEFSKSLPSGVTIDFQSFSKCKVVFSSYAEEVLVTSESGTSYVTSLDNAYFLFSQKLNAGYKVL